MSNAQKSINIFVFYDEEKEKQYSEGFFRHLPLLEENYHVELSFCGNIKAGKYKERVLLDMIKDAQIFVLLMDIEVLNTDFYKEKVSPLLLANDKIVIYPILMSACNFQLTPLFREERIILPRSKKAISSMRKAEKEQAYVDIVREIASDFPESAKKETEKTKKATSKKESNVGMIFLFAVLFLIAGGILGYAFWPEKPKPTPPKANTILPARHKNLIGKWPKIDSIANIFRKDFDNHFSVLVLPFDDFNDEKYNANNCIGQNFVSQIAAIESDNSTALKVEIREAYIDEVRQLSGNGRAKEILEHTQADVLIYGNASERDTKCTSAKVCFNYEMNPLLIKKVNPYADIDLKTSFSTTKRQLINPSEMHKDNVKMNGIDLEKFIRGLAQIKGGDVNAGLACLGKMDTTGLAKQEKAERFFATAFSFYKLNEYITALENINTAIDINGENAEYYRFRGDVYSFLKKYDKAILDFDKAININPNLAEVYNNRGNAFFNLKKYDKAILDFDKAININPKFSKFYINRGVVYAKKKDYNKAILDFDKVISISSNLAEAYYNRGVFFFILKDYNKAILDFDKAISINPNFEEAYYNRGCRYAELQEYNKAIADFNKAISINPNLAEVYTNRGVVYAKKKDYNKAILDFDKAISINPNLTEAYYNRGCRYAELQEYNKAIADFNKVLKINPNNEMAQKGKKLAEELLQASKQK